MARFVQYVGTADVKELDAAAWANVGVKDQKMTRWSGEQKMPVEELSKDALKYLEGQEDFKVIEE